MRVPKGSPVFDPEFRRWVAQQRCLLADHPGHTCDSPFMSTTRRTIIECCHIRVRKWGDKDNAFPGCHLAHSEWHAGQETFAAKYALDMPAIGRRYWAQFTEETAWQHREMA